MRASLFALAFALAGCPTPPITDAGGDADGSIVDARDAGPDALDGGRSDGGPSDGGPSDGGPSDGGADDGGITDGGPDDGGMTDSGIADSGMTDSGIADGGIADGGTDAGELLPGSRGGFVGLSHSADGARSFGASFRDIPIDQLLDGTFPGCVSLGAVGDCVRRSCPPLTGGSDDAGTVSVTTVHGATSVAFMPGNSYSAFFPMARFDAGDLVTFAADGAFVPAFEESVVAPAPLAITLPATIRRAEPLVVTWAATTAEEVTVSLSLPDMSGVRCRMPGSRTSLTIDASLFDSATVGQNVTISATASNGRRRVVGAWDILFWVVEGTSRSATVE